MAVFSLVDVASGVRSKLGEVTGWGTTTTIGFDDVQYVPGGKRLVTDSNYYDDDFGIEFRIHLWDVEHGKLLKQVVGRNSCCSPNGKLLAIESWPDVKTEDGQVICFQINVLGPTSVVVVKKAKG